MRIQIKNPQHSPNNVKSLFEYFKPFQDFQLWQYMGLIVEIDPTFDFKDDNALIRWTDIYEGFNDKIIVNSMQEFNAKFKLLNA